MNSYGFSSSRSFTFNSLSVRMTSEQKNRSRRIYFKSHEKHIQMITYWFVFFFFFFFTMAF